LCRRQDIALRTGCIFKKLNYKTPKVFLIRHLDNERTEFGFGLVSTLTIAPNKFKNVHLGVRLFSQRGCKILPSKRIVEDKRLIVSPLMSECENVHYIDSLSFRIKNVNSTDTVVLARKTLIATVIVKNFLHSRHSMMECEQLQGKYVTDFQGEVQFKPEYSGVRIASFQERKNKCRK
jgi:hypothetical protein